MQALHKSRFIVCSDFFRSYRQCLTKISSTYNGTNRTYHRSYALCSSCNSTNTSQRNHVRNLSRRNRHWSRISGIETGFEGVDTEGEEQPLREHLIKAYNDSLSYCRCKFRMTTVGIQKLMRMYFDCQCIICYSQEVT